MWPPCRIGGEPREDLAGLVSHEKSPRTVFWRVRAVNLRDGACPRWRECPEAPGSQEDHAPQLPSPGPVGDRAPESEAEHTVRLTGPRPASGMHCPTKWSWWRFLRPQQQRSSPHSTGSLWLGQLPSRANHMKHKSLRSGV